MRGGGGYRKIQVLSHIFEDIISIENLLEAWREFLIGKRGKRDVQDFGMDLMDNLFSLRDDLVNHCYHHGNYVAFNISDPKPRKIHKATVRDRLLHHAIHRILYPFFDRRFISDSYSCRVGKGTHKAMNRFRTFAYQISFNHTATCWVLKCDIRKFFASIDHRILKNILAEYISDSAILWLLSEIIDSFQARPDVGLPLGNLTSQLFANIYMNVFDQFVKCQLRSKYYVRYADDFVFLHYDKGYLEELLPRVGDFLQERLCLNLHPNKVSISTLASGIDFLGWVHFSDHRVLRTNTKRRMVGRLADSPLDATTISYRGLLQHGNSYKLQGLVGIEK